jgi:hypothetical protein
VVPITHRAVDTSHTYPSAQADESAHVSRQRPALHLNGAQLCTTPAGLFTEESLSHAAAITQLRVTRSQLLPATQSASVSQSVRHAVLPHTYGAQSCGFAAVHAPAPSHPTARASCPAVHAASAQITGVPGNCVHVALSMPPHRAWQMPDPGHMPRAP